MQDKSIFDWIIEKDKQTKRQTTLEVVLYPDGKNIGILRMGGRE
jgi:hypothetical protein